MDNLKFYVLYFAYILTIILFSACKKTEEKGWYQYDVTQCHDKWNEEVISGSTIQTAALQFLNQEKIEIDFIKLIKPPRKFTACEACNCPSGQKLQIKLRHKSEDETAIVALGFYGL